MRQFLTALAALALVFGTGAEAALQSAPANPAGAASLQAAKQLRARQSGAKQSGAKPARAKPSRSAQVSPSAPAVPVLTPDVQRVAGWVGATGDNQGLPFLIIDKRQARLTLFSAAGEPLDQQPVLIGLAVGDRSSPGVGSKNLAEIGTAEKTTPAGRFLARFGLAGGQQQVLWVDYANSVALHPIPPTANPKEQRRKRLLSPVSDDHRITFGCINVPRALYSKSLVPLFRKQGGYVYVLPDELALDEVFPLLRAQPLVQVRAEPVGASPAVPGTGSDLAR